MGQQAKAKQARRKLRAKQGKGIPCATKTTLTEMVGQPNLADLVLIYDSETIAREALSPTPAGRAKLAALRRTVDGAAKVIFQDENYGEGSRALIRALGRDPDSIGPVRR